MELIPFLKLLVEKGGSDLFFSTGAPVHIKVEGETQPLVEHPLKPGMVKQLAYSILSDAQQAEFERELEMNLAISIPELGRFRVNVFRQRGEVSMAIRHIRMEIPPIEQLGLPPLLKELIMLKRGLILVVGATGSGKSTTLASMIDHRNREASGHILTIEDPIEFVHRHHKSVVDQREVGLDTLSYSNALRNAMREAPDVILIGEIRDRETMQHAIAYAETGHLCLSTLHASNAGHTLERIINFFPEAAHRQLYMDLSLNLQAIIGQRLLTGLDGRRLPAVEVMLNSAYISDLIRKGDIHMIRDVIGQSRDKGMQTFDQALFDLYKAGKISQEEAIRNADSRHNVSVQIRLLKGVQ